MAAPTTITGLTLALAINIDDTARLEIDDKNGDTRKATVAQLRLAFNSNHQLAGTDATYDIGASGASRFRDLFLSRNIVAGGTATATSVISTSRKFSFVDSAGTSGQFASDGVDTFLDFIGSLKIRGAAASNTLVTISSAGVITTTGKFNTATSVAGASFAATGGEWFANATYGASVGGYGSTNDVTLFNRQGIPIVGIVGNTSTVTFAGAVSIGGAVLATTDATTDIGASGANRFRDLFLSRNATIGGYIALPNGGQESVTGILRLKNNDYIRWRNAANNNNYGITLNSSNQLFGEVDYQLGSNSLRWDEAGVRSWSATASGGKLNVNSGDAAGTVAFNTKLAPTVSTTGTWVFDGTNSHATNPFGYQMTYSTDTNDTGHQAFYFTAGAGTLRYELRSNGGIANFSANNVNLSDETVKTMGPSVDGEEAEAIVRRANFRLYKYNDQTHDDWNIGLGAREFYKAVKDTPYADSLVARDGFDKDKKLWGIHEADTSYLLAAALKNAIKRIDQLERRLAA